MEPQCQQTGKLIERQSEPNQTTKEIAEIDALADLDAG